HRPALLAGALVIWSLTLGLAGFATGLALLAFARLLSGGVATIARPVAVSLTGDIYDPDRRGRALANLDAGQAAGTAVCFLAGALAVRLLNWQWLFWCLAASGVVMALAVRRMPEPSPARAPGPSLGPVLRSLVRVPTNRLVLIADSVGNFFFAGVASFSVL